LNDIANRPGWIARLDDLADTTAVHDIADGERSLELLGIQHVAAHYSGDAKIARPDTKLAVGKWA